MHARICTRTIQLDLFQYSMWRFVVDGNGERNVYSLVCFQKSKWGGWIPSIPIIITTYLWWTVTNTPLSELLKNLADWEGGKIAMPNKNLFVCLYHIFWSPMEELLGKRDGKGDKIWLKAFKAASTFWFYFINLVMSLPPDKLIIQDKDNYQPTLEAPFAIW